MPWWRWRSASSTRSPRVRPGARTPPGRPGPPPPGPPPTAGSAPRPARTGSRPPHSAPAGPDRGYSQAVAPSQPPALTHFHDHEGTRGHLRPQILRDHGNRSLGTREVTAQMAGQARTTALLAADQAAPNPSRAPTPAAAATGPAAAKATGPNANAVTVWKALTLDNAAAGTCCCVAVAANAPPSAPPTPATRAPAATPATGECNASRAQGTAYPMVATVAATIGRRGLRPSASRPPTSDPPPKAVITAAHAPAPPRYSWAKTGPRTRNGPHANRLNRVNCTVVITSQLRVRNSAQPSARSASSDPAGRCGAARRHSRLSATTLAP